MDSTSGSRRGVDKTARTLLHPPPQPSPVVSLEKGPSVSSPLPPSLPPQLSGPPRLTRSLGHALRRNAAGAFGPDLAKKLSQLVKMEKNVMRSLEQVAKERMEVAVRLPRPKLLIPKLTVHSNNSRSGARPAMKTYPT